jgi:hypothetical protein
VPVRICQLRWRSLFEFILCVTLLSLWYTEVHGVNTEFHGVLYSNFFSVLLCDSSVLLCGPFGTRRFTVLTQSFTECSIQTSSLCHSVIPLCNSVVPLVLGGSRRDHRVAWSALFKLLLCATL